MDKYSILKDLIQFNTAFDAQNKSIMEYIDAYLAKIGFKNHYVIDNDTHKLCLVAEAGTDAPLGFVCHTDTVQLGNNWKDYDAMDLTIDGDKLVGLGISDMKGGLAAARSESPDLAILDVMLPDGDGFSLMQQIRTFSKMPIIFLTAKDEAADKLAGLGLGADDYVAKPFLPQELLLRIYAVMRRCYKEENALIILDGCTVDLSRAEVKKDGEVISLTAKEHIFLETLARNEGKIVTVDALCEALWGDNPFGYENSLNAHVRRIREKIETDPSKPVSLITIKGLGYKLNTRK